MGKSVVPSPARLQEFSRVISSNRLQPTRQIPKPARPTTISSPRPNNNLSRSSGSARLESKDQLHQQQKNQLPHLRVKNKNMEAANKSNSNSTSTATATATAAAAQERRVPLVEVVADCMKRWFQDTLKEAKAGDTAMQVLVSQMYSSGYGIPKDPQKGRAWMNKASRTRSSAWKVSDKHPGYNASDSDSEDTKDEAK